MTEKRFKITQNGDLFTVRDTVENKPMGVFEFKEDEFPVYFCFHKIIDLMNDLSDENEHLKQQTKKLEAQLYCNHDDGVCSICKHCYLEEQSLYYISKCEKGHEQCSKEDVKYCEDFEIKGDLE